MFSSDVDDVERALHELQKVPRYPFSDEVDRPMVRSLIDEFPTVDVPFEISKWALWMAGRKKNGRSVNWRVRIKVWIRRAAEYQRGGSARAPVAGTAEAATAHGATSAGLEQW